MVLNRANKALCHLMIINNAFRKFVVIRSVIQFYNSPDDISTIHCDFKKVFIALEVYMLLSGGLIRCISWLTYLHIPSLLYDRMKSLELMIELCSEAGPTHYFNKPVCHEWRNRMKTNLFLPDWVQYNWSDLCILFWNPKLCSYS